MTGGSRGIGKAIAVKVARDGANVVIAAKTSEPHAKLPGTIHTAAAEIEQASSDRQPTLRVAKQAALRKRKEAVAKTDLLASARREKNGTISLSDDYLGQILGGLEKTQQCVK